MATTNLGSLSAGNIVLTNGTGSINFLKALSTAPQIEVLINVFDACFSANNQLDTFDTLSNGTASVSRAATKNYISLFAPQSNDVAILQSKVYSRTSSSASRIVAFTVNLDPLQIVYNTTTNAQRYVVRAGSFDSAQYKLDAPIGDGYYFQLDYTGISVGVRISTDGTQGTDTLIAQSTWNLDKLDGTGLSQYTLQVSAMNQFLIVYENSVVKLGIVANGSVIYCHQFTDSTRTQALPVRVELTNGTLAANNTNTGAEVKVYKCAISSSGKLVQGIKRSISTRAAARDISAEATSLPVMSVRLSQVNARATALFTGLNISSTVNLYYEILLNGTLQTPTWKAVGGNSICEYDTVAETVTGGSIVYSGYVSAKIPLSIELKDIMPLSSTITGVMDTYTVNVIALMTTGVVYCSIDVQEIV